MPIIRRIFARYENLPYMESYFKEAIKKNFGIIGEMSKIDYSEAILMKMHAYFKNSFNDCYCCSKVYQIIFESDKSINFNQPTNINELNFYLKFINDNGTEEISLNNYKEEIKLLYSTIGLSTSEIERNLEKW